MPGLGHLVGQRGDPLHPVTLIVLVPGYRTERNTGWELVPTQGLTVETHSYISAGDRSYRGFGVHPMK